MKKIIIAIDSFKGSLSSAEIANAVEKGLLSVFPSCEILKIPIADGGEGTVEALVQATQGKYIQVEVNNPLMQPVQATYGILGNSTTAVIEISAASGLTLVPWREGLVMETTTYGTGELIRHAIGRGCREFIIGIGGSATNDAGVGMLAALGFRFLNAEGKEVAPTGSGLKQIVSIDCTGQMPELQDCRFHILTDVKNPFCSKEGAAYIFAPQKGATPKQVELLDEGLEHIATLLSTFYKQPINKVAGAGAGGGIAGGCLAMLNAEIEPGIEVIKQQLHFDEQIKGADLILTGEGKVDGQTMQGKVVSGVLTSAHRQMIPVVVLTGNCADAQTEPLYALGMTAIFSIHPAPISLKKALEPNYTATQLTKIAEQIARLSKINKFFEKKSV